MEIVEFELERIGDDDEDTIILIQSDENGDLSVCWDGSGAQLVDVGPEDFSPEERALIEERVEWERKWWAHFEGVE